MRAARRIAGNTGVIVAGKVLGLGLSLAIVFQLTGKLSVAEFGHYNFVFFYVGMFSVIVEMGMSPILVREGKKDLIVAHTADHVVGIGAAAGKVLWKYRISAKYGVNANSPLYGHGGVDVSGGYDSGGVKLNLSDDGSRATEAWRDRTLDVHHGAMLLLGGYIYGSNWISNTSGNWVCLDYKTGKVMYETTFQNKGAVIWADGLMYCYIEQTGTMALVRPTPKKFDVISTFTVTKGDGPHWAHPAIADGVLYIRHGAALMAYDIKAK